MLMEALDTRHLMLQGSSINETVNRRCENKYI